MWGFNFKKSKGSAAILVTDAPIRQQYYSDDTCFSEWMKTNFHVFSSKYKELLESNTLLWIVTKTYRTAHCSISCASGDAFDFSVEFAAKPIDAGPRVGILASTKRVKASGPGWAHYGIRSQEQPAVLSSDVMESNTADPGHAKPEDEFAMFAGGMMFKPKKLFGLVPLFILILFCLHSSQADYKVVRSDGGFQVVDSEGQQWLVTMSRVGLDED